MKTLIKALCLLALTSANIAQANELSDALLRSLPTSPTSPLPLPQNNWNRAEEVTCVGYRYAMQDRDIITLNIDDEKETACVLSFRTQAFHDVKKYCNDDDYCAFRGNVTSKDGNFYSVNKIVGGINEDEIRK